MDELAAARGHGSGQRRGGRNGRKGKSRGKQSEVQKLETDDGKAEDDEMATHTLQEEQQLQPSMMKREGGLARLCRVYTGCRLDKSCQIGNWSHDRSHKSS